MERFKQFAKTALEKSKLKWQQMCSPLYKNFNLDELREIAKVEGIPYYKGLTKRELCLELSLHLSRAMVNAHRITKKCHNNETIGLESLDDLPPHRLYPYMENVNGKEFMYCFDIEEIHDYVKTNKQNPYTRQRISRGDIDEINSAYKKYLLVTGRSKKSNESDSELIDEIPQRQQRYGQEAIVLPEDNYNEALQEVQQAVQRQEQRQQRQQRYGQRQQMDDAAEISNIARGYSRQFVQPTFPNQPWYTRQERRQIQQVTPMITPSQIYNPHTTPPTRRTRNPTSDFLSGEARSGRYHQFQNMTDEELLSVDEYSRSYYYYLVFSQNYDAIKWLLDKPIVPPEDVIPITGTYRAAFVLKMRNPGMTTDNEQLARLLPNYSQRYYSS